LKDHGINLRLVVNWFENQLIDRGFNKGKNVFFPSVPSIGYQGYIVAHNFQFHLQPTSKERSLGVLPDTLAVLGENSSINKFCPDILVTYVPAFRFSGINNNTNESKQKNISPVILVVLPIFVQDSIEIISLLIEFVKQSPNVNIQWLVKPHPSLKFDSLEQVCFDLGDQCEIVSGKFGETIIKADLMVGSSSSTCMESLAYGVPAIVVGSRKGITQNPIPKSVTKDIWELCYTVDEVSQAIYRLCLNVNEQKKSDFSTLGQNLRKNYFRDINEATVREFLLLN